MSKKTTHKVFFGYYQSTLYKMLLASIFLSTGILLTAALVKIMEVPSLAEKEYILWSETQADVRTNTIRKVIWSCIEENNYKLFCTLYDRKEVAFNAARFNNKKVLEAMTEHIKKTNSGIVGTNNWNKMACSAAQGGHLELMKELIEHGANNYEHLMEYAINHKQKNIAEYLRNEHNVEIDIKNCKGYPEFTLYFK